MTEPGPKNQSEAINRPQGRPRLDAAFPSVRLMGVCAFLVVLALVFSGWNIVHLDRQWAELVRQREAFEKEKAALADYTAELPALERRRAEFGSSVAALDKERKILAEEVDRLEQQRREVQKILEEAQGGYHLAQSARQEAQRDLARIVDEINSSRPMLIMVEARLAVLKAREYSLREALAKGETQKAELAADLKGLEREQSQARDMLEKMINDRKTLQGFSDTVKVNAQSLNQAAAEAEAAAKKFAAAAADLGDSTRGLKSGTETLGGKIKTLEAQIAQLADRNKTLAGAVERDEKARREIQSQVALLTAAATALNQAGKEMESQVRKWAQRSDKTLNEVGRLGETLAPLPKNLEAALKSLSGASDRLAAQAKNLENSAASMRTKSNSK